MTCGPNCPVCIDIASVRTRIFAPDLAIAPAPVPTSPSLEQRIAELEAKSRSPAPVPELVEKHVLVQQLLRRAELAEGRIADLERKLAELWRRSM